MSARAQERLRAEEARARAIRDAEWAAEEAAIEEQYRPIREAGPPNGCHECYVWVTHGPCPMWWHSRNVQPGPPPSDLEPGSDLLDSPEDWWCWHPCHGGSAVFCGPVAYGW
jgi:hypothetical protein